MRDLTRRTLISTAIGAAMIGTGRATIAPPLDIVVSPSRTAQMGRARFRCAVGRGGIKREKREGDGVTPAGTWPLREVLYRADRMARPLTALPVRALKPDDGWCDAPGDANYNRHVRHPYPASAEKLWRRDHIYDLIVVVGYNDQPVVQGAGSAIFLHFARSDYSPTAGCIAFAPADLLKILANINMLSDLIVRT
jgi:L,D-peptidoglycan transpeptidase YkuD (ErfK/YbiS/YcfS/YnhG family)